MERVFHNRTNEPIEDTYDQPVPVGRSRVRVSPCICNVPCKGYVCKGCKTKRPWCCGGHPDVSCDYCVAKDAHV